MENAPFDLDTEVFEDYFLALFSADDGRWAAFEMYDGHPLDKAGLLKFLTHRRVTHYTFNGKNFDLPVVRAALAGADCATLKRIANDVVVNDLKPWDIERKYHLARLDHLDHVDLMEVAPGKASLKIYGGRLHCRKLQDLPLAPDARVEPDQRPVVLRYCRNDVEITRDLRRHLRERLDLRVFLSNRMNAELEARGADWMDPVDLRSKSDAQIAEAVLKHRIFMRTGAIPRKRPINYTQFDYVPPEYIKFSTDPLRQALEVVRGCKFVINAKGRVTLPKEIAKMRIVIGETTYKLGIGGLHSQEKCVSHYATDTVKLRDIDVVSYYPRLMLNMGMYPDSMGPHFLAAFEEILDERVAAKRAKDKTTDAVLKITLNGTFGKTSNQYSILYNPKMTIYTTLTGQLSILMLIEALEKRGIPVVSANTDGIVVKFTVDQEPLLRRIVTAWNQVTNLETDETDYKSIHSRDVNSYVAFKTDGSVKRKGAFSEPTVMTSPKGNIALTAVIEYLRDGTPVQSTIDACSDIREFLFLRTVKGGAVVADDDTPEDGDEEPDNRLGKAIRWYLSNEVRGHLEYQINGNRVPMTDGARPLMDLPETFPGDVDRFRYAAMATEMLMDVGVIQRPPKPKLPRKNSKAWKEMVERGEITP